MNHYQVHAIEGASPIDLVVSLYDGIVRFLHDAANATERNDVVGRRTAVKKALDIIVHLQATLKMDVGGKVAETLAEYYAAMFGQILKASQEASKEGFEHTITCVQNVREAWKQVANDPEALESLRERDSALSQPTAVNPSMAMESEGELSSRWMA